MRAGFYLWALFLLFSCVDLMSIFSALNEMEEVAPEEGVAAEQGHNDVPAHSQAVVPMDVDEEQAGNILVLERNYLLVSPS